MYSDLEKELQVELLTLGNISELLYVVETLKIFFLIVFFFSNNFLSSQKQ